MPRGEHTAEHSRTVVGHMPHASAEERMNTFHSRLKDRGLKSTGQRDDIARVFFGIGRHISAEELYAEVKKVNPHVGYATIYRTLASAARMRLAAGASFRRGPGALRSDGRAASRSLHLRALRQDYRIRKRQYRAAAGDGRARAQGAVAAPQNGIVRYLRRLPGTRRTLAVARRLRAQRSDLGRA